MNYQAIRAVLETPVLTAFNSLTPAVPVYFDNVSNVLPDSVDEFVTVNIQFGLTTETTLTRSIERARGVLVLRIYTPKGKGPGRNQQLTNTAITVLETLNATAKPNTGVYLRTGSIEGPSFGTGSSDQESRRAFTPFFVSRIETGFHAQVLS